MIQAAGHNGTLEYVNYANQMIIAFIFNSSNFNDHKLIMIKYQFKSGLSSMCVEGLDLSKLETDVKPQRENAKNASYLDNC